MFLKRTNFPSIERKVFPLMNDNCNSSWENFPRYRMTAGKKCYFNLLSKKLITFVRRNRRELPL